LAQNSVPAGINRVKERLENGKLLIMGNCHQLIDEFRKYRWATPGRTENDPKEKPVKQDDHLLDALRYVVMHRPYGPELVEQSDESQLERLLKEDRMELNKKTLGRVEGIPV
jgi:phage terminase large subunit